MADEVNRVAVCSRRLVTPDGVRPGVVIIDGEKIGGIINEVPAGFAGSRLETGDAWVMPGLVDPHVHVNEPGRTEWEGYTTATRAAAAGGITAITDMPLNCSPVTTSRAALQEKLKALDGKLMVDCAFWGGVIPDSRTEMPGLLRAGVSGVKAFLIDSGLEEFPPLDPTGLQQAAAIIAPTGRPLLVHAELESGDGAPLTAGERSYQAFVASRPAEWEIRAIDLLIQTARATGAAIHIVHLSAAAALPAIRRARQEGLPLTVETCPHYLLLNAEAIPDGATLYKCCPPIRDLANQKLLWEAVDDGTIDLITSDHSPCMPAAKLVDKGDLHGAWGGIASLQFGLPLLATHFLDTGRDISRLARLMCAGGARLIGLEERKGKLQEGFDADLVIWMEVPPGQLGQGPVYHRHRPTPWADTNVRVQVRQTILRGRTIYKNDEFPAGNTGTALLHP